MTFSDDFERLSLGSGWADDGPIFEDEGLVRADQFLSGGAWQSADADSEPDAAMASIRRTDNNCTDQFVEAVVGNFFQGHDGSVDERFQYVESELWLFAQLSPASNVGIGVYFIIDSGGSGGDAGNGRCDVEFFTTDSDGAREFFGDATRVTPLSGWQSNPDYTIRLEVSAAGHCKVYFEGDLVTEADTTPIGGQHVGIGMQWNKTNYGGSGPTNPGVSIRWESVTGSLCAAAGWRVGRVGWGSSPW